MLLIYATLGILILTSISNTLLFISTRGWITSSHLSTLDSSILTDFYWTFLTTTICFVTSLLLLKRKSNFALIGLAIILGFQGFYEFYRGFFMFFDSGAFLSSYGSTWISIENSKLVYAIAREFKCCGFHSYNEFNRTCKYHSQRTCLSALNEALGSSIKSTGFVMIGQSIALVIAAVSSLIEFVQNWEISQ